MFRRIIPAVQATIARELRMMKVFLQGADVQVRSQSRRAQAQATGARCAACRTV